MAANHAAQHSRFPPQPPAVHSDFRLPSLKDLNFQYRPPPPTPQELSPASPQVEHNNSSSPQDHSTRHNSSSWGRPPANGSAQQPPAQSPHHQHQQVQHTSPVSTTHEPQTPKQPVEYTSKHDSNGYLTPGVPLSAQLTPMPGTVNIGPGSRGDETTHSQNSLKRSRADAAMSVPRDNRSSHASYPPQYASYPPPPPPPPVYHQVQPAPPPPHEQIHHPAPGSSHPAYGYHTHPQQYVQPRPHLQQLSPHQQSPHHPQQQHSAQRSPYQHPPAPQDPWEHHHQQHHHQQPHPLPQQHPQQLHQPQHQVPSHQQHQPHPQMFLRTTALVPTNLDTRSASHPGDVDKGSTREGTMSEIVKHCTTLYSFASRYAQLQANQPRVQPPAAEMVEMTQRASEVVRLLEELRRMTIPHLDRTKFDSAARLTTGDDHRPPKRPWEDTQEENVDPCPPSGDKGQSTAEMDMEIIRTKRASTSAGGPASSGQQKSKYRKRSRATPPGKCHSCNIRETPEWRRGPDGARTLCNACGLHYAKLMRKRDKALGLGANDAPRIDMDTLRASARAADLADKTLHRSGKQQHGPQGLQPTSPAEAPKPLAQHHQGSFQLLPTMAPPSGSALGSRVPGQVLPGHGAASMSVPPPPWATAAPAGPGGRGYAPDQLQHQSFIRTSQHRVSNGTGTSPR